MEAEIVSRQVCGSSNDKKQNRYTNPAPAEKKSNSRFFLARKQKRIIEKQK